METKILKAELLTKCAELGITKCSSKKKSELIELINAKTKPAIIEPAIIEPAIIEPAITEPAKTNLKPIIKWSGGKGDEIKQFYKYIPVDYDKYIEPFIGGGALYFHLMPEKAVINDVHAELIDLYKAIGEGKSNEIYKFMVDNLNNEETYYKIRNTMPITNSLDNAKRFYYQRKTCFRGMSRYNKDGKFNIPFGKYKSINYSDLQNKNYETLLSKTEILNKSFEYIFENYNDERNFMFLDPPYDSEFTDYGYCKFGKEEQKKLAKLFKETKIRCLIIIGKTKFIEELYKDYIVDEYDKKYKFKLYAGRIGDEINTKHLVIKNY
jgi:DNA adenine methylase